jgi:hypothetical protein
VGTDDKQPRLLAVVTSRRRRGLRQLVSAVSTVTCIAVSGVILLADEDVVVGRDGPNNLLCRPRQQQQQQRHDTFTLVLCAWRSKPDKSLFIFSGERKKRQASPNHASAT